MARLKEGVEMLSKLALPIAVAAVGFYFNYVQEKNNNQQLALSRTTKLLEQLTSKDPAKRKGAIIVIDYLVKKGQIEPDLMAAALFQAAGDSDKNVANLASLTLSKVAERNEQFKEAFEEAAQIDTTISEYINAAQIEFPDKNFLTCENVENRNPIRPTKQFNNNKVWLWARVHTPLSVERLRLDWVDLQTDSVLTTMNPEVENVTTGWRIYYSKNMPGPGDYAVRLFNSYDQLMAEREFTVNQLTVK